MYSVRRIPGLIRKISLYVPVIIYLFAFLVLSVPSPVQAADPKVSDSYETPDGKPDADVEESVETQPIEEKSFAAIIVQLIFYTLLIIAMIYGLIRFLASRQKKMQPNQAVKLMGGTPLGNNRSLQLVKVGNQIYMIGVGEEVTLIKEFSSEDEINSIEKDLERQTPALFPNPVSTFIKGKLTRQKETEPMTDFNHLFNQSLDKQKLKQNQLKRDLSKDDEEGNSK
jgi:flagellar protein FliO/FliZ